jgi:hypothetical protein
VKAHEGLNYNHDECPRLTEEYLCIFSECKRDISKRLIEVLKGNGFVENKSDPCLSSKWDDK